MSHDIYKKRDASGVKACLDFINLLRLSAGATAYQENFFCCWNFVRVGPLSLPKEVIRTRDYLDSIFLEILDFCPLIPYTTLEAKWKLLGEWKGICAENMFPFPVVGFSKHVPANSPLKIPNNFSTILEFLLIRRILLFCSFSLRGLFLLSRRCDSFAVQRGKRFNIWNRCMLISIDMLLGIQVSSLL